MKQLIIYFAISLIFISCGLNEKKITQVEFERLFTHDSIQSISLLNNDKVARIRIKRFSGKNKMYILPIESPESFEISFNKLKSNLNAQHIFSSYSLSSSSGSDWPMYIIPFIYLLFLLSLLILFLIAVIDVLKSRFETATDKLIWFLVILFVPLIGPILYFNIGRKQKVMKV
jgi:hypothetical protein